MTTTIQIPPKTQAMLTDLIRSQQAVLSQLNVIAVTLRETLDVPEDYVLDPETLAFVPSTPPTEG